MPTSAQTTSTSANTPSGAAHSTQRTMVIMVSPTILMISRMRSRRSLSCRLSAKPKNIANTTSGSIALADATASTLLGISEDSHCAAVGALASVSGACSAARKVCMVALSCGTRPSSAGVTTAEKLAAATSSTMNTRIALRAVRPDAAALLAVLTPTITSAVTSGTTVICSALSHSRPIGRANSATCSASAGS